MDDATKPQFVAGFIFVHPKIHNYISVSGKEKYYLVRTDCDSEASVDQQTTLTGVSDDALRPPDMAGSGTQESLIWSP
jgi:hypothetical protein